MAVTAKRDNMRIIAVVLGEESGKVRNSETMELLDYGFNLYKVDLVKSKDDKVGTINLDKADKSEIDVYPKSDISILGKKSDVSLNYSIDIKYNEVDIPLKKGSVVGKIIVKNQDKVVREVDAIIKEDISKISYFKLLFNTFKGITTGDLF